MRKLTLKITLLLAVVFMSAHVLKATDDVRLLRFPDINKDLVAFVYAGDIWTVNSNGGDAKRLTSHEGMELFPKISPDGEWIAFSAEYSGTRQVYVMPSKGGTPKQLTYYNDVGMMPPRGGYDYVILDWTRIAKMFCFVETELHMGKEMESILPLVLMVEWKNHCKFLKVDLEHSLQMQIKCVLLQLVVNSEHGKDIKVVELPIFGFMI